MEVMEFGWAIPDGGDGDFNWVISNPKVMLLKCCAPTYSTGGTSAVATGQEKVSFRSNPKERDGMKEWNNYRKDISLILHAELKLAQILQIELQ